MSAIGDWQPYFTPMQTYMRRRIFGLFWQKRLATDDEIHALFAAWGDFMP